MKGDLLCEVENLNNSVKYTKKQILLIQLDIAEFELDQLEALEVVHGIQDEAQLAVATKKVDYIKSKLEAL